MSSSYPFFPPNEATTGSAAKPTICIDYFYFAEDGFCCTVLSHAEIVEQFRRELIRYCTEMGFDVVDGEAEYRIVGVFARLDQGNQFLRWFLPGVLGANIVQVTGRIMRGSEVIQRFDIRKRTATGVLGGSSRSLLDFNMRRIAMKVAADAISLSGRNRDEKSAGAHRYLGAMIAVAGLVSIALAWAAYRWALAVPVRPHGLTDNGKPWWACFVGTFLFAILFLLGLATAPTSVLTSRTLLPLRSMSGVKTISAQRVVLVLLCAAPIGLLFICYMCL
jgi:hypothetical protein